MSVLALEGLLALLGDDRALLGEVIVLFDRDSARYVAQVREAADRLDGKALNRALHSLKGLLSYFGETEALGRCRGLEALGADVGPTADEVEALAAAVDAIRRCLADLAN